MFKRIALGAAVLGLVACARTVRAPEGPSGVVVSSALPLNSPPSPHVETPEDRALAVERQRSTRADDEIARDVNEALRRSRRYSDLDVRVNDRVVELSGTVASLADAADAAAASYRVAGVYAVTSRIGVLGRSEATDAALERRVLARLASLPGVSATRVTPSARHGRVVLRGAASGAAEERLALAAVSRVPGVVSVRSELEFGAVYPEPGFSDSELAGRVQTAIDSRPELAGVSVNVSAQGGEIVLEGELDEYQEMDSVLWAAFQLRTHGFKNRLSVRGADEPPPEFVWASSGEVPALSRIDGEAAALAAREPSRERESE
jgi:osmotically-inducible protein OsmY